MYIVHQHISVNNVINIKRVAIEPQQWFHLVFLVRYTIFRSACISSAILTAKNRVARKGRPNGALIPLSVMSAHPRIYATHTDVFVPF